MTPRIFRFPGLLRLFYRDAVFRIAGPGSKIYLSFDDGPTEKGTEAILKVLKQNEVDNAVFFCTGSNIQKYPGIVSDITGNGYTVANHGYIHLDGWKSGRDNYVNNCLKGSECSGSLFYRPPYGRITGPQYKALRRNMRIVFWDILLYDWDLSVTCDYILRKAERMVRPGSVIVLHDKENHSAMRVLDGLIGIINDRGYEFGDLTRDI
ncbi:MAG TPA: hypothetical protein DEQ09_02100 [Bacteroidales bacterium]|nr:hypothetical protein [Bacteroidales bacterium]